MVQISWLTVLLIAVVLFAVALVAVVAIILIVIRKPTSRAIQPSPNLSIDLSALQLDPVPAGGPTIEVYGVPARLVVFVLAPAGRHVELPDAKGIRAICERILPGLAQVIDVERPLFRRWPNQLSSQGFVRTFYANMLMPGDRGIGTTWSGVAGKFESGQGSMVAGLVFESKEPNSIGQITVERPGMWHDILRVRSQS